MSIWLPGINNKASQLYVNHNGIVKEVKSAWVNYNGSPTMIFSKHIEVPTWADGTDAEILAALNAHYSGMINLHNYWNVGDERTIQLTAMTNGDGVGESHESQSVVFVISNKGGKYLADGVTECAFQIDQKGTLGTAVINEFGYMNATSTNFGGWRDCLRRSWCNNTYYNALPSSFRNIIKQHQNYTSAGNVSSDIDTTIDYIALRSEIEVTGSASLSFPGEGSQIVWYQTASNRKKINGHGDSNPWFLRSPMKNFASRFMTIDYNGASAWSAASGTQGITVFACI